jgi:hypothetical protein
MEHVNQNNSSTIQENQDTVSQDKEEDFMDTRVENQSPIKRYNYNSESPKTSQMIERESLIPSTPPVHFPASPLNHPHTHSRIRTESVCSIKSNFSGIGFVAFIFFFLKMQQSHFF